MELLTSFFILDGKIPSNAVSGQYNLLLVFLSYVIACLSFFTAISVLKQIDLKNQFSIIWGRLMGALVMGAGIWSMHFMGMLAFQMKMTHTYNVYLTVCSLLISILFSYVVFLMSTQHRWPSLSRVFWVAVFMGLGVTLMHYIGMASMEMNGTMRFIPSLFFLSIVIGIGASMVAIWLMRESLMATRYKELLHILVALVLGLGVCGLHYTGMEATVFIPFYDCRFDADQMNTGMVNAVIIVSTAITLFTYIVLYSQRQSLDTLREERRYIQSIINAIPDLIFVKNSSHVFISGNDAFSKAMGGDKYIGTYGEAVFPPEQLKIFWDRDDEVSKNRITDINEEFVSCADGRIIHGLTTKSPLTLLDGTQGLVGVIHDIGALKAVEESLKETNQLNEAILDSSSYAIISTDELGTVQIFNRAAELMLGYSAKEIIGKLSPALFHDAKEVALQAKKLSADYQILIEPGFDVFTTLAHQAPGAQSEWTYIRKDGSTLIVSLSLSVLYKDTNRENIVGYLGIATDITQRKKDEEELKKHRDHLRLLVDEQMAQIREEYEKNSLLEIKLREQAEESARLKSEFLSNMSHELRTPMHAILNYANMGLKRKGTESEEKIEKYFNNIMLSGNRLLQLLNNLLDLSKMDAGKMIFTCSKEHMPPIIDYIIMELGSLIKAKNIQVALDIMTTDTAAFFDKQRIIQVFVNIFSNALRYSPEHGAIKVSLSDSVLPDGTQALLCSILNQGEPIPENELQLIFDKFTQSSRTKSGAGGTGLGLAISRDIIEGHGGAIWAANNKGGGVVFSVLLPRSPKGYCQEVSESEPRP